MSQHTGAACSVGSGYDKERGYHGGLVSCYFRSLLDRNVVLKMQGKSKNPRTVTLKPECVIPLKLDP